MGSRSNTRIFEFVKPFTGKEDIEKWLMRFEMVVASQKLKNEEMFLPLLLEGDALAVFLEMKEELKESAEAIKAKLRKAFGEDPFEAFRKLYDLKWEGEPVEVYASKIKRLLRLAKVDNDLVVKRVFVCGLPIDVRKKLRAMKGVEEAEIEEIIEKARVELSDDRHINESDSGAEPRKLFKENNKRFDKLECFACGENHLRKDCIKKNWRCFKCGHVGHIGKICKQGNEERGAIAQEIAP